MSEIQAEPAWLQHAQHVKWNSLCHLCRVCDVCEARRCGIESCGCGCHEEAMRDD